MGCPYEFTYGLLMLCLSVVNGDQRFEAHKSSAKWKECLSRSVPVC